MGHGREEDLRDLVVIDARRFDRARSLEAVDIIDGINSRLLAAGRSCVLIGPGRWGTQDRWLGIPVAWGQITSARAIVETDFADLEVEPSQGSHFFHNLACFGVAYFTVHASRGLGHVDWEWLMSRPAESEAMDGVIRHIRVQHPLRVMVDGRSARGVILRGGSGDG